MKLNLYGLYYPFYDYNDNSYLVFMTNLFKQLEIRQFPEDYFLASELEDCSEALLIEEGVYKAGFMVNNKDNLLLTFGSTTRIGIYNMLF